MVREPGGSDKAHRLRLGTHPLFPQPGLPPQHEVDGVHQLRTDSLRPATLDGAEVRKRQIHRRGFLQEEEAERHPRCLGEVFQLSHGGQGCFGLAVRQIRKPALQIGEFEPAATTKGSRLGGDESRFGDRQLRSGFALPALTVAAFAPGTGLSA